MQRNLECAEVRSNKNKAIDIYVEGDVKYRKIGTQCRVAFFEGENRIGQSVHYLTSLKNGPIVWLDDITVYSGLDEKTYKSRILKALVELFKTNYNPICRAVYAIAEDKVEYGCFKKLGFVKVGENSLKKELVTQQ
jgi:hypothetical protein